MHSSFCRSEFSFHSLMVVSIAAVMAVGATTNAAASDSSFVIEEKEEHTEKQVAPRMMETIVVTATRETKNKWELAESVSVLNESEIEKLSPSHPAEALNRVAGVHINNLGGEGHMSAIRQPITTSGVYLFLEDGVPTRPTGYFNHNGLYEVNIPQSSRLEVTKGPASALYGSDAIGGVINAVTNAAPEETEAMVNYEAGSDGWDRVLFSGGTALTENTGIRIDFNSTESDGFRDEAEYERYSTTLRLDSVLNDEWTLKAVASYTDVDQSGVSSLEEEDYKGNEEHNRFHDDIGYREVEALRLSAEFSYQPNDEQLFTMTPFYRDNTMEMMPSWMVTYDPNVRDYQFQSYGLLLKFRQDFLDGDAQVVVGMDTDYTPSSYEEEDITVTLDGDVYTGYSLTGAQHYDFESDQLSISPYIHTEWQFAERWRLTAGLRYDYFDVDYDDKLAGQAVDTRHLRPESEDLSFDRWSPKFGLVYQYADQHNAYFNYRHAFRAPTIGNLFRPGSAIESTALDPVTSKSIELGFRGQFSDWLGYELAFYEMKVKDDIVSFIDGTDRKSVNAGETEHRGVELTLQGDLTEELSFNLGWAYTEHEYEDFKYVFGYFSTTCFCFVQETRNFSGFDIAKAPKHMGNVSLAYRPQALKGAYFEVEMEQVGKYYTDETNTSEYEGHRLVNLRASYDITSDIEIYGRLMNLLDKRYSTLTSNQVGDPDISYRPGQPFSAYMGIRLKF